MKCCLNRYESGRTPEGVALAAEVLFGEVAEIISAEYIPVKEKLDAAAGKLASDGKPTAACAQSFSGTRTTNALVGLNIQNFLCNHYFVCVLPTRFQAHRRPVACAYLKCSGAGKSRAALLCCSGGSPEREMWETWRFRPAPYQ
jgi:hypothetical protein